MSKVGRPTVLDPIKIQVICALIQVGVSQRRAAAVVGVTEGAIRYWIRNNPQFAQQVAQAEALLEVDLLVKLNQAAGRSWRAATFALKYLVPDRFGEKKPSLVDPDREADREFHEMQAQRELDERAAAEAGQQPPPEPKPDPNDPTTAATRAFAERLDKTIAGASRSGQAASNETNANTSDPRRPDSLASIQNQNPPRPPRSSASPKSKIHNPDSDPDQDLVHACKQWLRKSPKAAEVLGNGQRK